MSSYEKYRRAMADAKRAIRDRDWDYDGPDPDETILDAVKERPCSVCGQLCRDITALPKCRDCGPTNPDRWNR